MTSKLLNEQEALLSSEMSVKKQIDDRLFLSVDRPALTVDERHAECHFEEPRQPGRKERLVKWAKSTCGCSREKALRILYLRLPILSWLIGYDFKNWLVGDLVAGVTVAILHIPQGMGFALLANIPAICGIYMAFFQSLIYAIFATSQHNSMGTFAVITLMTGKVVKELATFPDHASPAAALNSTDLMMNATDPTLMMADGTYTPIQIATIVTFMVGIWHMIFGVLQLGSLAVFLSDMLVSGFTTAAAVHVLTSQMKDLLGIKIPSFNGPLKIIYTYIEIAKAIPHVNLAALIITIITITVLVFNNEFLKPIVAKYSRVPIPIELIAVIVGTASSYLATFDVVYEVEIIGNIPTGLPPPTVPPLELMGRVAVDSLVIAIVSYTINFSLAKIFGTKHDYPVDATQELYANGLGNLFSCFFSCAPMASALARALIQDSVGGVTQMASLVVAAIILLVLLFIGPVFETLPKAVLASIIIVALKGMFLQFRDMIAMFKVARIEAIIWLVTFCSVVIIDIDFGLLIGIIFSLFVLLAKNQSPQAFKVGRVPNTDIYLDMNFYPQAKDVPGLCLFKIIGPIHFANRESLKQVLVKRTGLDPKALAKAVKEKAAPEAEKEKAMMKALENGSYSLNQLENQVRYLVLDVSGISYVDSSGSKFLERLRMEYESANVSLCIAGMPENMLDMMRKASCLTKLPSEHLFHSLHDAVVILTS